MKDRQIRGFCKWFCGSGGEKARSGRFARNTCESQSREMTSTALFCLLALSTLTAGEGCENSETTFNGYPSCRGDVIFEEDFNFLNLNTWRRQVRISGEDFEFSVYSSSPDNSYVRSGKLHIKPTLYNETFVRTGHLELAECTGREGSEACAKTAKLYNILPPVQTAQLCTDHSFNFKYGVITVGAKLPLGEWITPQIWLKPKEAKYGPGYMSGKVRLAMARGNKELRSASGADLGAAVLESGVLLSHRRGEHALPLVKSRTVIARANRPWGGAFRNYSFVWKSDEMSFYYDGKVNESVSVYSSASGDLATQMAVPKTNELIKGSNMAPFDQEFHICLGVTVGNNYEIPDGCTSNGRKKPWENLKLKGLVKFWLDKPNWLRTWSDVSELTVDHVTVTAV